MTYDRCSQKHEIAIIFSVQCFSLLHLNGEYLHLQISIPLKKLT